MKFQLPTIVLLAAASQFCVAGQPTDIEVVNNEKQNYAATQAEAQSTAEKINTDAGTLPEAVIKVADSLELKLEQRLQASFDLGFISSNGVASAH